ncbi:MAG: hypothetical protein FWD76_04650, partial [Firmicutes bacterium]|nr:hypothetical protein [Bacillota bacterium]
SLGIKAALMAVGEDVLAFGSVHKSVYDGCKLAGKNLFLCGATGTSVETTQGCTQPSQLAASLTVQDLKDAFAKYPTVCAVAFTSPDYFGRVIEREVWEFARSQKKIILNDAAHGAHFLFAGLQDFAYFGFADITITSAHKTLATLTQGALSLVANEGLLQRFEHCLDLLGTTSPSYLLLASIEYGVEYAYHNQKKYVALQEVLASLKQSIYTLDNADYTRLVVDCKHYGMCGKQVFDALVQRGIVAEMYTEQYLVFIVTICDSVADIETLQKALHDILKITNQ